MRQAGPGDPSNLTAVGVEIYGVRYEYVAAYIATGQMVVVLDTGALARDVLQSSRGPRLTSLLVALDQPGIRGFVTTQIGLLRRHFPKATDLSVHTAERLAQVAAEINDRPRKTLGWQRPVDLISKFLQSPN